MTAGVTGGLRAVARNGRYRGPAPATLKYCIVLDPNSSGMDTILCGRHRQSQRRTHLLRSRRRIHRRRSRRRIHLHGSRQNHRQQRRSRQRWRRLQWWMTLLIVTPNGHRQPRHPRPMSINQRPRHRARNVFRRRGPGGRRLRDRQKLQRERGRVVRCGDRQSLLCSTRLA